jgi:hypothetical protein
VENAWNSPPRQAVGGSYTILQMDEKVKSGRQLTTAP